MSSDVSSVKKKLLNRTSFFGVQLWVLIVASTVLLLLVVLILLSLCIISSRRRKFHKPNTFCLPTSHIAPKNCQSPCSTPSLDRRLLSSNFSEIELNIAKPDLQLMISDQWTSRANLEPAARCLPVSSEMWKGNRFSLREMEVLTNGFSHENVVGSGDHGVVYRGVLLDSQRIAVKRLLDNSCKAEDLIAEMEAIGNVRHKNLVKLLGYCIEGAYRMLVYEYVDNGNLHQWLHGSLGQARPLSWTTRMNIIQGVAKGLAYLHEDIEQKIVHRQIKSTNILLDHQWNPKISDVGLNKFLSNECNHAATSSMLMSGYGSGEYALNGVLNEKSDVYSFGVLIMEIVSGRTPVDHSQSEVYLVKWLKSMVANQRITHVLDSKLLDIPAKKELKRIILIALRCVDPEVEHRPKMGNVIRMLEPGDLLLNDESQIMREPSHRNQVQENQPVNSSRVHELEGNHNSYEKMIPK